eukprot:2132423-Rhodomonas_salina.3
MRCPVLTERIVLRYQPAGTNMSAIGLRACYAMSSTYALHGATRDVGSSMEETSKKTEKAATMAAAKAGQLT